MKPPGSLSLLAGEQSTAHPPTVSSALLRPPLNPPPCPLSSIEGLIDLSFFPLNNEATKSASDWLVLPHDNIDMNQADQ